MFQELGEETDTQGPCRILNTNQNQGILPYTVFHVKELPAPVL